jgi:hypothetical protein
MWIGGNWTTGRAEVLFLLAYRDYSMSSETFPIHSSEADDRSLI